MSNVNRSTAAIDSTHSPKGAPRARAKALPRRSSKTWFKLSLAERNDAAVTRSAPFLDALSSSFADAARAAEMSARIKVRDALESLQNRADTVARIAANWASFSEALERDDSREGLAWLLFFGLGVAPADYSTVGRPWDGLVVGALGGFATELFFMIEYVRARARPKGRGRFDPPYLKKLPTGPERDKALARLDAERDARLLEKLERLAKRCAAGVR